MKIHTETIISAAHHLPNYGGKCKNLHGHSWKIEVDLENTIGEDGMVIDFAILKNIINKLDHQNLNDFIENPTAENIVYYLLEEIHNACGPFEALQVKVWESATSYACDSYNY